MRRFFNICALSICVLFLIGCEKDDDTTNNGGTNPPEDQTATFSAVANDADFESENAWARYKTTGALIITAIDDDGAEFKFVIANFIGNATYDLAEGSANKAIYSYDINGNSVQFSTTLEGKGILQISNFDESTNTFDGIFYFTARQIGSTSNILTVEDGDFRQVKIQEVQEPEPTFATGQIKGRSFSTDDIMVRILNNFYLEVIVKDNSWTNDIKLHTPFTNGAPHTYLDYAVPTSEYNSSLSWGRAHDTTLPILEYDSENHTVSIKLQSDDFDMEIWLKDVPISQYPMIVDVGNVSYNTQEGNIINFDNALLTVQKINEYQAYYIFEAFNDANNKLTFQSFYYTFLDKPDIELAEWEHELMGWEIDLRYYDDADNWNEYSNTVGFLSFDIIPDSDQSTSSFGFISYDVINSIEGGGVEMRSNEIPRIE